MKLNATQLSRDRTTVRVVGQDGILRAGCQPVPGRPFKQRLTGGLPTRRRLTTQCHLVFKGVKGYLRHFIRVMF